MRVRHVPLALLVLAFLTAAVLLTVSWGGAGHATSFVLCNGSLTPRGVTVDG